MIRPIHSILKAHSFQSKNMWEKTSLPSLHGANPWDRAGWPSVRWHAAKGRMTGHGSCTSKCGEPWGNTLWEFDTAMETPTRVNTLISLMENVGNSSNIIELPIYRSIDLPTYLPTYLSIYRSIDLYLSIYLSIFLSIYLSFFLSICLSIYLSVYLSYLSYIYTAPLMSRSLGFF